MAAERFWFASTEREFLGEGVRERYDGRLTREAIAEATARLGDGEVLAGWLPFEPGEAGTLVRPERLAATPPRGESSLAAAPSTPPIHLRRDDAPSSDLFAPHEYRSAVSSALERIDSTPLEKVVLARAVEHADAGIDLITAMQRARRRNPRVFAFVYDAATGLESRGRVSGVSRCTPSTLFGASPELLVRRRGPLVISVPLAGSRPRGGDPVADRAAAVELLASEKDRAEHAVVVRQIVGSLERVCTRVMAPSEPSLVPTDAMWHLATTIQGVLDDPTLGVVDVAVALHPTPAICGTPIAEALDLIRRSEPVPRGLYAGAVGWCDRAGDGEWAVTLRAGQRIDGRLRLHAGAGIVAGSVPDDEWHETAAKLRTMEGALGVQPVTARRAQQVS